MIGITRIHVILGKKQVFGDIKGLVHVEIYYKPTLICIDFISWLLKIPYDYFSRPCFIHTHFDIIHIRQSTTKTSFRWETFATKSFSRISRIFLAYKWKLIYSMWNEITKFSWDWKKNVVLCKCWFTVYIGMIRSTYTYYKVLQQSKEWYLYPLTCSSAWLSYWKSSLSKGLLQLR